MDKPRHGKPRQSKPRKGTALRGVLILAAGVLGALLFPAFIDPPISNSAPVRDPFVPAAEKSGAESFDQGPTNSKDAQHPAMIRWSEAQPGCTFSRGADGKYSYGLWTGDIGIILAIDARELQVIHRRIEPILGVLLTVHYRGNNRLDMAPDGITLEFAKHFKVLQPAVEPDSYSRKIQADADAMDDETRRAIKKHPDEKQLRILALQEYQQAANELIEFLNRNSLRAAYLDRMTPEAHGWVFFNTDTKWIGGWKPQEEFVLRFPLAGSVFEFPFKLPPEPGELLLRKRE
jgi:hypothetical protein